LALAVSTMLYIAALAEAPLGVSEKSQFFRPTVKGRMLFSARWILRGGGATQSPEIEPDDPLYGATAPKEGAST